MTNQNKNILGTEGKKPWEIEVSTDVSDLIALAKLYVPKKEEKPTVETKVEIPNLENKLTYDENGKPKLNLIPLEKTVVNIQTQEDYLDLMRVYEAGGRIWQNSRMSPMQSNNWEHKRETCIKDREGNLTYGDIRFYKDENWKIISPQEFYDLQNPKINLEILKELKEYYNKKQK